MTCLDDATVLGLVEGRLVAATLASVDEHIDQCESCRDVVTLMASSRSAGRVLARGDTVGRFVIGDLLGTGAMGRVYSAWEPELDRRVAIKVLIEDGGSGRERLVREAQAMAKLSHPNVVTVHEVGTASGGVYVAMELVDGDSLRAWVGQRRPWREIVRVLVEVLRGLVAVHGAGVVHRDIKPDNMIVGADGRVRLGDFGLARAGARSDATQLAIGTDTTVAGTPVYMAPEVLRGGAATAASDQFSFGVMAYELLAGMRPFAGSTWAELLAAIETEDAVKPLTGVPVWLDAIVRRCLAVDPAKRYPSLAAVADELSARLAHKRPTRWIAAAALTAAVASIGTYVATRGDDRGAADRCTLDDRALAWSDAFAREHAALGAPTLALAQRWIGDWRTQRVQACRTQIAAHMRCLDHRAFDFRALLTEVERTPQADALAAFTGLQTPAECTSVIDDSQPLPLTSTQASAARNAIAAMPTVRAFVAVGDREQALERTTLLVALARQSEHDPTLAEALIVHADALRGVDRLADAAVTAREAAAAATMGRADLVNARAWLARLAIAGERRDLATADDVGTLADAAVRRAGAPAHLAATLARLRGLVAYNRGDLPAARTLLVAARQGVEASAGATSLEMALVESALGSVERAAGDLDAAERHHRAALAIDRALRGDKHRDIARDLHNIAGVLRLRGTLDAALATYQEALAIETAVQGERSIAAGLTTNSIGLILLAQQKYDAARERFTLARDILTAADHGDRAIAEHNLGLVAQALNQHAVALDHFAKAEAIYARTIGTAAAAPEQLRADRERSLAALKPAPRPPPRTVVTKPPAAPAPPKPPTGVYHSSQTW